MHRADDHLVQNPRAPYALVWSLHVGVEAAPLTVGSSDCLALRTGRWVGRMQVLQGGWLGAEAGARAGPARLTVAHQSSCWCLHHRLKLSLTD